MTKNAWFKTWQRYGFLPNRTTDSSRPNEGFSMCAYCKQKNCFQAKCQLNEGMIPPTKLAASTMRPCTNSFFSAMLSIEGF